MLTPAELVWLIAAVAKGDEAAFERLYAAMRDTVLGAQVSERFPALGYEPVGSTPEEFSARYRRDIALYARIIREARIPLQD